MLTCVVKSSTWKRCRWCCMDACHAEVMEIKRLTIILLIFHARVTKFAQANGYLEVNLEARMLKSKRQSDTFNQLFEANKFSSELCFSRQMTGSECTFGKAVSELTYLHDTSTFKQKYKFPFTGHWPNECFVRLRVTWKRREEQDDSMLWQAQWREIFFISRKPLTRTEDSIRTHTSKRTIIITNYTTSFVCQFSYQMICDRHFYGNTCERYCRPARGVHGNFICDSKSGERVCRIGWTGEQCDQAICDQICKRGKCIAPNQCSCDLGWFGLDCSACRVYPGCVHGSCKKNQTSGEFIPYTCECEKGWRGILCNLATGCDTNDRLEPCNHRIAAHVVFTNESLANNDSIQWVQQSHSEETNLNQTSFDEQSAYISTVTYLLCGYVVIAIAILASKFAGWLSQYDLDPARQIAVRYLSIPVIFAQQRCQKQISFHRTDV